MKIRLSFLTLFCILAVTLSAQTARSDSIVRVGACATPGITWGVFVQDSFAYVADCGGVTVVNVSNPSNPWITGTTSDAWANGIFVRDTLAYVNPTGMWGRMFILNIANPSSLHVMGWCRLPPCGGGTFPVGICIRSNFAYLANGEFQGIVVADVSDPTSPDTVQCYSTPGYTIDLSIQDTLLYVVDSDSLLIWNISNPFSLFPVSSIDMPAGCYGVCVLGNYAYVACPSTFGNDGRLVVVDISNPSLPQIASTVNNINGDPVDVQVYGSYAYVVAADYWAAAKGEKRKIAPLKRPDSEADIEGGLRIVDIANPDSAQLIVSYDTPGDPRGVFVDSDLVFVTRYDSLQKLYHHKVGIEEEKNKAIPLISKFSVFPNPMSNVVTYKLEFRKSCYLSLNVYDRIGRKVKEIYRGSIVAGRTIFNWDGKDGAGNKVSKGTYFVRAEVSKPTFQRSEKIIYIGGRKLR